MPYDDERARSLVGKPRSIYQCNHVVNYALTGNKDSGPQAKDYLAYGFPVFTPAKGVVVVGENGKHVGIFISDTEFIHSSESAQKVIVANLAQLYWVFNNKYELRQGWF